MSIHDDSSAGFARSGSTHPLGKFDTKLPEVNCHQTLVDELRVLANREGVPVGEFIRTTLEVRVWGVEHVASLERERIRRIAGNVGA